MPPLRSKPLIRGSGAKPPEADNILLIKFLHLYLTLSRNTPKSNKKTTNEKLPHFGRDAADRILVFHGPHDAARWPYVVHSCTRLQASTK